MDNSQHRYGAAGAYHDETLPVSEPIPTRLCLKYFSRLVVPRAVDQVENRPGSTNQEFALSLSKKSFRNETESILLGLLEFTLFKTTGDIEWLNASIKHQEQALEDAGSSNGREVEMAVIRHNLAVVMLQKFDTTENAEDLESLTHAATKAEGCASLLPLPKADALDDLTSLRNCAVGTGPQPSVDLQGTSEAFAALGSECTDEENVLQILGGDWSVLCRTLRQTLQSPNISWPARLRLAEALALSAFYRSCDKGLTYEDPELIGDLDSVSEELDMLDRHLSRCFYLGTLGYALQRKYIHERDNFRGNNKELLEKAERALEAAIRFHIDSRESPSDVFKRHALLVIGDLWGTFLHFPAFLVLQGSNGGHPTFNRTFYVAILATVKLHLYDLTQQEQYLHDAERLSEEAYEDKEVWGSHLGVPGVALVGCYEWRYVKSDSQWRSLYLIEKAMSILDHLDQLPLPQDNRIKVRMNQCRLAAYFCGKSGNEKNLKIIDHAIEQAEAIHDEIKGLSPDVMAHLSTLSKLYMERTLYPCSDIETVFNKAFEYAVAGVMAIDEFATHFGVSQPDMAIAKVKARQSYELWHQLRFQYTRDRDFLRKAIEISLESIAILTQTGDSRPVVEKLLDGLHIRLASTRCILLDATDSAEDLGHITESINWLRSRIMKTEDNTVAWQDLQTALCKCLVARFSSNDEVYMSDSDELKEIASHIQDVEFMNTLSNILSQLYKRTGELTVLDQAIDYAVMSVSFFEDATDGSQLSSPENPGKSHWIRSGKLFRIAELYLLRVRSQKSTDWSDDAEKALKYLLRCVNDQSANPMIYVAAANLLSHTVFVENKKVDISELAMITKKAVRLLHKVIPRSLNRRDIQKTLRLFAGVASNAAAAALEAGMGAQEAIELIEAGRGMLSTQLLDFRSMEDYEENSESQSQNTSKITQLKEKLHQLEMITSLDDLSTHSTSGVHHGQSRAYTLNEEIEEILEGMDGSSVQDLQLLRSPTAADMKSGICDGTMVILNVSFRHDAIIIRNDKIESVPLPLLAGINVEKMAHTFEFIHTYSGNELIRHVLERTTTQFIHWLWIAVVEPVLSFLGFDRPPSRGQPWPRVWWIATGFLSQFPFHAAGNYLEPDERKRRSTLDYVVSSYSPSVRSLLFTSQNLRSQTPLASRQDPLVVVSMGETEGLRSLPFAASESKAIESLLGESIDVHSLREPEKKEVLKALQECNIFHFAGHGKSQVDDPDQGSLYTKDWKKDALTVRDILNLKLHLRVPWLAYLSACSTGTGQANELRDESIHLVSAFQLAGFQHVVGSFWQVSDRGSRQVAEDFYTYLKDNLGEGNDVALALHFAIRKLRNPSGKLPPSGTRFKEDASEEEDSAQFDTDVNSVEEDSNQDPDELLRSLEASIYDLQIMTEEQPERDGELVRRKQTFVQKDTSNTILWAPYYHIGL